MLLYKSLKRNKGLTLVEIMVATVAFSVFATMLFGFLMTTVNSYSRTKTLAEMRYQVNFALRSMQIDISRSIRPTIPTADNQNWIPSGVLLPNPYNAQDDPVDDHVFSYFPDLTTIDPDDANCAPYASLSVEKSGGISQNRLVMFCAASDVEDQRISDPYDFLNQLVFVEYVVPETAPFQIWKNTYRVNSSVQGFSLTSNYWVITSGVLTPSNTTLLAGQDLIAQVPGNYGRIFFEVVRENGVTDLAYNTAFDRHFMEIFIHSISQDSKGNFIEYGDTINATIMTD
ncbi:MAG: PilW family protein [Vulcanimicrobiota bacterium]